MAILWLAAFMAFLVLQSLEIRMPKSHKRKVYILLFPILLFLAWCSYDMALGFVPLLDLLREIALHMKGVDILTFVINLGLWAFWPMALIKYLQICHSIYDQPPAQL